MDQNDQQAIGGLFNKLATVEREAPQRDAEAESFINSRIAEQPSAPYYMAQTIVVQEQALNAAQARIEELEQRAAEAPQSSGGLFGGLFGGASQPRRSGPSVPRVGGRAGGMGQGQGMGMGAAQQPSFPPQQPAQRGGGFLAGAAQTAMGVAGGVLLGNAITGMFGGNEAQAAEAPAEAPADGAENDAATEDASFDDGGGFDLGGFDDI